MQSRLSNTLNYFLSEMSIDFDAYMNKVGAFLSQGYYTLSARGYPLINSKGFIGRYQFSISRLNKLGVTKNVSQNKINVENSFNWIQSTTNGAVEDEILAPIFGDTAIFSLPDSLALLPKSADAFLENTALQDNCFIASSYINFTRLKSLGIITGKETSAERAGWMGVTDFLGLGNPLSFVTVAVGMDLTVEQAQLLSAGGGALGLFVNWKLTPPYSPTTNAVPDISGMIPYDYFQMTAGTQT